MKKLIFIISTLLITSFSMAASAAKESKTQAQEKLTTPIEQPSIAVTPQTVNVTLVREKRDLMTWYEDPVLTGFAGALGAFILTSLTGFFNRWLIQKQGKKEYKRKLIEMRRQKHLEELKNVYQETTTCLTHMQTYSNVFNGLAEGANGALKQVESLEELQLYRQVMTVKEHIELHLDPLLSDMEKVWKSFKEVDSLIIQAQNNKYENNEELKKIASSLEKLIKQLNGIRYKSAKQSRDLHKV